MNEMLPSLKQKSTNRHKWKSERIMNKVYKQSEDKVETNVSFSEFPSLFPPLSSSQIAHLTILWFYTIKCGFE